MARNIIFLGAGASASEGAPIQANLFRDYFDEIRNTPGEEIDNHLHRYFFKFWGIDLRNDRIDDIIFPTFEEALGMLELARNRQESFRGFFHDVDYNSVAYIIEDLIFLIARILESKLKDRNTHHIQLIRNLIRDNLIKETAFISLNYDILIDNAITLFHDDIDLDYGIDFMNYQFEDDWGPPDKNKCTKLFKIHGSLNWLYCPICKQIMLTPKIKGVTQLIKKDRKTLCPICRGRYIPVLIPPTFFKVMSNPYLIQTWDKAEHELKQSEKIIFCGYSMPDADIHIKYLLKRVMLNRTTPAPSIIVINNHNGKEIRTKEEEKLRYRRLFGIHINYTETSFDEFADHPSFFL